MGPRPQSSSSLRQIHFMSSNPSFGLRLLRPKFCCIVRLQEDPRSRAGHAWVLTRQDLQERCTAEKTLVAARDGFLKQHLTHNPVFMTVFGGLRKRCCVTSEAYYRNYQPYVSNLPTQQFLGIRNSGGAPRHLLCQSHNRLPEHQEPRHVDSLHRRVSTSLGCSRVDIEFLGLAGSLLLATVGTKRRLPESTLGLCLAPTRSEDVVKGVLSRKLEMNSRSQDT